MPTCSTASCPISWATIGSSSFIVFLYLYVQAAQQPKWSIRLSHQAIATATGLSYAGPDRPGTPAKASAPIVSSCGLHPTAVPLHRVLRPWLRLNREKS